MQHEDTIHHAPNRLSLTFDDNDDDYDEDEMSEYQPWTEEEEQEVNATATRGGSEMKQDGIHYSHSPTRTRPSAPTRVHRRLDEILHNTREDIKLVLRKARLEICKDEYDSLERSMNQWLSTVPLGDGQSRQLISQFKHVNDDDDQGEDDDTIMDVSEKPPSVFPSSPSPSHNSPTSYRSPGLDAIVQDDESAYRSSSSVRFYTGKKQEEEKAREDPFSSNLDKDGSINRSTSSSPVIFHTGKKQEKEKARENPFSSNLNKHKSININRSTSSSSVKRVNWKEREKENHIINLKNGLEKEKNKNKSSPNAKKVNVIAACKERTKAYRKMFNTFNDQAANFVCRCVGPQDVNAVTRELWNRLEKLWVETEDKYHATRNTVSTRGSWGNTALGHLLMKPWEVFKVMKQEGFDNMFGISLSEYHEFRRVIDQALKKEGLTRLKDRQKGMLGGDHVRVRSGHKRGGGRLVKIRVFDDDNDDDDEEEEEDEDD
ncbi:hypothetical protein TREMEDRAFT_65252 [Tremella mesenterica DSM 1558]|uniref:uncharacterized protein n=1 Tax=Tremella mesenterica (strain ATCC 24925 / CBS 8224 / DSM 1558 / NBRC 9311 / NRRL Y-6157 / RJB 2259-6 / UBC 559-6) TaxID=578456 RepID=UPI00032C5E95|nr:uncharacterized protein TREMEDRAFT_65252 [Tremella mesenterica DSM 1558]EIW66845.1 hypothetical protein TREMEDRAFT_65252 [Tremella mesenterica DSM 1558]